jgi:hypothetical protein
LPDISVNPIEQPEPKQLEAVIVEQRNAKAEIPPNGMEISRLLTECSLLREALAEARRQLEEMKGKLAVAEGFYYRFEQTAEHNKKKLAASGQRERELAEHIKALLYTKPSIEFDVAIGRAKEALRALPEGKP